MFDAENSYDDGYGDEINPESLMGMTSLEDMRQQALHLFGMFVARTGGKTLLQLVPQDAGKFLSIEEVENIIKEHSVPVGDGFAVGGNTKEEALNKMRELFAALMNRVMSNVLHSGVERGWLDFTFNTEANDFEFTVTEEGKRAHAEFKRGPQPDAGEKSD